MWPFHGASLLEKRSVVKVTVAKSSPVEEGEGSTKPHRLRGLADKGKSLVMGRQPGLNSRWLRIDPQNWSISRFLRTAAEEIPAGALVLDAGAGTSPYLPYFRQHRYQSCDTYAKNGASFIADLHHIPVADCSYDAIICTQVLEHVQYPQKVLQELFRVLQPSGRLYLTAPQGWGLHQEPHHYFNFTRYGLELLFRDAGFQDISIQERGGILWYLSKRIRGLMPYLYAQHKGPAKLMLVLLHLVTVPFLQYALPMMLFYLDPIDKRKAFTLGYACTCRKLI